MSTQNQAQERVVPLDDGEYQFSPRWAGMVQQDTTALCAAAFPVKPPSEWFRDPALRELTPLTIDNTGRVFGHIAGWKTAHIGLAGGVRPPKSKSGYAFFRTGSLETAEGDFVDVGQITLAGGHAPLNASVEKAVAHYDDTKSAVMDVSCGEDRHGIWVAGALRPSIDDETIRTIRASSVSGDWRPINGRLEMVAVCAVNCPGFPIPRSLIAGGVPIALTAAGTEPIVEKILHDRAAANIDDELMAVIEQLRNRVKRVEKSVFFEDAATDADIADELADVEFDDGDDELSLSDEDNIVQPSVEERISFLEGIITDSIAGQRSDATLAASIEQAKEELLAKQAITADGAEAEAEAEVVAEVSTETEPTGEAVIDSDVADETITPEATAEVVTPEAVDTVPDVEAEAAETAPVELTEEERTAARLERVRQRIAEKKALEARAERIAAFKKKVTDAREARVNAEKIAEMRSKVHGVTLAPADRVLAASLRDKVHQK